MFHKTKKLISAMLTVAMLFSLANISVFAEETQEVYAKSDASLADVPADSTSDDNNEDTDGDAAPDEETEAVSLAEAEEAVVEEEASSDEPVELPEAEAEEISISEARDTLAGTEVTVNGVVTRSADGYIYIQDSDAGIAVLSQSAVASGSVVKVRGILSDDEGLKIITADSLEILSDGGIIPEPVVATVKDIYDGKYQGMLVKIVGSKVVSMDSENITIRDDNDATVIQIVYSTELNPGIMKDAKIDVVAIATARTENYILKNTSKNDITISVVPLAIGTEEELDAVRNNMYGNYILTNDIELTKYWIPLGTASRPFYGSFNGNGHTISELDIQLDLEYWYQYAGFMGYMGEGAKVSNLTVIAKEGGSVKAKTQSGSTYTGGIVAYGNKITVDNCAFYGVVESADYAGYIVGYADNESKICNCRDIEIADGSKVRGGIADTFSGTIENCSVISGKISRANKSNVGGIVGSFNGSIKDCYVTADSVTGSSIVGGVIGYASGAITAENCYATADVKGNNEHIGGFIGYTVQSFSVADCYATGNVSGSRLVGGFAGYATGTFTSCYATGDASGTEDVGGFAGKLWHSSVSDCYASGQAVATIYAGGFAGTVSGTYTRCYSLGDVRANSYVGGFAGHITGREYVNGNRYTPTVISECYSISDVYGQEYVGGFAGMSENSGGINITTIKNCWSYDGYVSGQSYTGGFIGYNASNTRIQYCYCDNKLKFDSNRGFSGRYDTTNEMTRCYFNKDTNPNAADDAAVGKTNEQLAKQATYLDWDFVNTWAITPGFNNNFPYVVSMKGVMYEAEYISVSTEAELNNIRYDNRKNYRLAKDIELSEPWVPIESFSGIFDGNGHTISNLTMADTEEYSYSNGGLFANLESGAKVKNLTVRGDVDSEADHAGILVGINYGMITDCQVVGTVNAKYAGGLAGNNYGYIADCDANVTVTGKERAGGLVSYNDNANIENCSVKGRVLGSVYAGGIVAWAHNKGTFTDCHVSCDVSGGSRVGGFVGWLSTSDSTFKNCSAIGKITGSSEVGGFIGGAVENGSYNAYAYIYNCYSKGSVYAGGDSAGGFVGVIRGYGAPKFYVIAYNSYTTSNVRATNNSGGFAGYVAGAGILEGYDCYAADGKIVGSTYVGGFVGLVDGVANLTRCMSRSYLSANASSYAFAPGGTLTRCYYDIDRSFIEDGAAVGKTSEQLKDQATYLDWDFADVWAISADKNGGYPYLQSVSEQTAEDEEYTLITNEQDLINIRYNLSGKYKLANDITLKYNWIPIGSGTDTNTFSGTLDGDGHTIYGFNVPCNEEYEFKYAAMFASISPNATIENLNIVCREDGGVETKDFGSDYKYAAGIVVNNYGIIRNCGFSGSVSCVQASAGIAVNNYNTVEECRVTNSNIFAQHDAAGIVAYNSARVADCHFEGTVSADCTSSGDWAVGGIVAKNYNYINNCTVAKSDIYGDERVGGIAGYTNNNIYNCKVTDSDIRRTVDSGEYDFSKAVGGIAGESLCKISGCTVTGCNISTVGSNVGGLVGFLRVGTLINSTADVRVKGVNYVGGAVGMVAHDQDGVCYITNVKTSGLVEGVKGIGGVAGNITEAYGNSQTYVDNSHSSANVIGSGDCVGGLVGYASGNYNGSDSASSRGRITKSSSSGSVTSSGSYVGGLVGKNKATISESFSTGNVNGKSSVGGFVGYNLGPVSSSYSVGSVTGSSDVGGFIGKNINSVRTSYARGDVYGLNTVGGLIGRNSSTVQYTYATGFVYGHEITGGIAAVNTNSILNSYYDSETTGQNDTGKGIPKSTFELMQQMNYVSWDFDTVWTRRDNYNNGYAYLKSLAPAEDAIKEVIEISSEEDLRKISANLNGDYVLTGNITLTKDWTPVGNFDHNFNGSFDGKGFTVSGVNVSGSSDAYVGFFGVIGAGGEVCNLTIETKENGSVCATSSNSYAGGLAGLNLGRLDNCFVNGTVTGQGAVGGLVGKNSGVISYSATSGAVNGINNVGGLVGSNSLAISRSYSTASVVGTSIVGGLIGYNGGNASSSYATGNVTARGNTAGGFVAKNEGSISSSSSSNNVTGSGDEIGGFVGLNSGSGAVITNSSSSSVVSGHATVGGFVGSNYRSASISNCYSGGSVHMTDRHSGGFAGFNSESAKITNCYTNATVTGSTTYRGGFSGVNYATVTNCYFDSTVAGFTNTNGGTAKTTTQMYTPSEYSGWDFDAVWTFDADVPGYPYLSWQTGIGQEPSVIPAISVAIKTSKKEISVGEALALTAVLTPASATDAVLWTSSDNNTVAITGGGVITGIKAGKATITAKAGNVSASVEITVADKQLAGDIVSVNSIADIHIPFGSDEDDAKAVLPGAVSVVLNNATLVSLPVEWTLKSGTEYSYEGTITLSDTVTNTKNLKALVNVVVDEAPRTPANITSVDEFELSVSYGTALESVLSSLPAYVVANLSDGTTEKLMVSWNSYSEPDFNPYGAGEYEISGEFILPGDGTVVNPEALKAIAKITVEPMPEKVRNVVGTVANPSIEVAYGTELSAVKDLLPTNAYAVVEGPVTVTLPVTWSAASSPEYSKYVAGEYLFIGTLLMPDDGKITNTSDIKTTVVVKVLPSTRDAKNIFVSDVVGEIGAVAYASVSIDKDSAMSAGSFCISFDNAKLTPVDYKVGALIESTSVMVNMNYINPETNERTVKVSFIGNEAISDGGEIVKIGFLINESTSDGENIAINVIDAIVTDIDGVPVPVVLLPGNINALQIISGDVNSDGKVNVIDAFKILRYDVGFVQFTEREALAADVDKNGEIDIFDALYIQKYDIGLSAGLGE